MLYNVVLSSAVYQHEPVMGVMFLPLELPSHLLHPTLLSAVTEHKVELPVLQAMSHYLSVNILHMVLYIFQCYSLSVTHPLLPPLCLEVFSLCLSLHSCPANSLIASFS